MKKVLLVATIVLLTGALWGPASASVLKTVAGGGTQPAGISVPASDLNSLEAYSARHGLTRHYYTTVEQLDPVSGLSMHYVIRVNPYDGSVDWMSQPKDASFIEDIAVDVDGSVYVAVSALYRVYKIGSDGEWKEFAGNGSACGGATPCGDNGHPLQAQINPVSVAVDDDGNVYIGEYDDVVRKVDRLGTVINRVAGQYGQPGYNGDGIDATLALLNNIRHIDVDSVGNLLIADNGNHCVRLVDTGGTIWDVAGVCGSSGVLGYPKGVDVDQWANLYIANKSDCTIKKVDPSGVMSVVAGDGACGTSDVDHLMDATLGSFRYPAAVSVDLDGQLYVADYSSRKVKRVAFNPVIETATPSAFPGDTIVISGKYFGRLMGVSSVTLGPDTLASSLWTNTELHAVIPPGATSGNLVVHAEGGDSNPVNFEVLTCTADEVGLCNDDIDNDCDGFTDLADLDCQAPDCSTFTDKNSCNAEPTCRWNNKDKICIAR